MSTNCGKGKGKQNRSGFGSVPNLVETKEKLNKMAICALSD